MALSASESALLTETCQNMNQAANTCRDVLEMLRSLGSSGVVDIATHNNDSDAHANVDSIAKIDTSKNSFSIGKPGDVCNGIFNGAPFRIIPAGTGAGKNTGPNNLLMMCESRGNANLYPRIQYYFAETDSNGNLYSPTATPIGSWTSSYKFLSNNEEMVAVGTFRCEYIGEHTQFTVHVKHASSDSSSASTQAYILNDTGILPYTTATYDIGSNGKRFKDIYLTNSPSVSSDRRVKTSISELDSKAMGFIKSLNPVQFCMATKEVKVLESDQDGAVTKTESIPGTRRHWGLIAQEVREALISAGYDPSDCAVWCLSDKEDPNSQQALRYEELIAPLIKAVQVLAAKVEALEGK